jgi:hypothetical protein
MWPIIARPECRELGCPCMMWKTKYAHASALPAIAAALALSSTPAWSQEAQPTAEPAPVTIDTPPPVVDTAPADTSTVSDPATATDTTSTTDTVTETAVAPKPKAKAAQVKATKSASTKPATTTRVAEAAPARAAPAAPAAAAPVPAAPSGTPQPIVDTVPSETATATPAPEAKPLNVDENALMLGGGALALLALGGGALAVTRRRRHEDEFIEETPTDESMAAEPVAEPMPRHDVIHEEQPAIVAPSAFAWGNSQPAESQVERNDDETWVERAYQGPTEDNPSLSLRKRLKRAAFFDARERRVAAGKAEPVATDAGLPENVANDTIRERELELA